MFAIGPSFPQTLQTLALPSVVPGFLFDITRFSLNSIIDFTLAPMSLSSARILISLGSSELTTFSPSAGVVSEGSLGSFLSASTLLSIISTSSSALTLACSSSPKEYLALGAFLAFFGSSSLSFVGEPCYAVRPEIFNSSATARNASKCSSSISVSP